MEIEPGKQGFFRDHTKVRIDSYEEMFILGAVAPFLSAEGQRWHRHMSDSWFIGGSFPESFPVTISVPETVLARTAGNLMLRYSDARPGFEEAKLHMIREVTGYFTHTSPSERARLVSMGKQIVGNYEASHNPSIER